MFGLLYQFLPRKVSTFSACLDLSEASHVKHFREMVIQIYASLFFLLVRPLTHADQVFDPGGESGRRFPPSLLLTAEIKASVRPVCLFQLVAFLECFDDCKGVFMIDCGFDAGSPSCHPLSAKLL